MDEEKGGGGDKAGEDVDETSVSPSSPELSGASAAAKETNRVSELKLKCAASVAAAEARLQDAWFDALNRFHEEKAAAEQELEAQLAAISVAEGEEGTA